MARKVVGKMGNITKIYRDEYHIWCAMKYRCLNPKHKAYHCYGGRGITICDRWLGVGGFANFVADMGRRPTDDHSIERVDVNGNYEPSNCIWIPRKDQMSNYRGNVFLEHQGLRLTLAQWSRHLGIPISVVKSRYRYGWDTSDILNPTVDKTHGPNSRVVRYKVGDEMLSIPDIHRKTGIPIGALRHRLTSGWSMEEVLSGQRRPKGLPAADAPIPNIGTED